MTMEMASAIQNINVKYNGKWLLLQYEKKGLRRILLVL